VAAIEVAGRERRSRTNGLVQGAARSTAHVREAVEEQDYVRVPLRVSLVDHERGLPRGRAPVDRAQEIPGDVVAETGVFDAVRLRPRHVASGERLRLDRRQQAVEELFLRVGLERRPRGESLLPADEAAEA